MHCLNGVSASIGVVFKPAGLEVLRRAGDNLTRANIMNIAASLGMEVPMLIKGVNINTGPDDYFPIERMQLWRFDGTKLVPVDGKVYGD